MSKSVQDRGRMVLVVGSSGAGKDSIISAAQKHFAGQARIEFVRRIITRADTSGAEKHLAVNPVQFEQMQQNGEFAVHWQANGLQYALPVSTINAIGSGQLLVANGSRAALQAIRDVFPTVLIIHVRVNPECLRERLLLRKRETPEQIDQRIQRNAAMPALTGDVIEIDNSDARHTAIDEFIEILSDML